MVAARFPAAPAQQPGARHTTSSTGPTAAPPRWATWCWYVRTTTPACTITAGVYDLPPTGIRSSSHRHGSTLTGTPDATPTTASPPRCPNHDDDATPPTNIRNNPEPVTTYRPHHDPVSTGSCLRKQLTARSRHGTPNWPKPRQRIARSPDPCRAPRPHS